jgi:hypothetical protein
MTKTAKIYTDDKKQRNLDLVISGMVEKFVSIIPRTVSLRGFVGDSLKKSVNIIPEEKYAFKITNARARSGKYINIQIKEIQGTDHREYSLIVENLRQEQGRYHDVIILETDSKIQPTMYVRVYGQLRKPPAEKQK